MASLRRPELVLLIGICFFDIYFFFQRIQIQLCSLHLSDLILRVYVNSPISSLSRSYSFQISYVPLKYPPRISPEYGIHTRQDPIPPSIRSNQFLWSSTKGTSPRVATSTRRETPSSSPYSFTGNSPSILTEPKRFRKEERGEISLQACTSGRAAILYPRGCKWKRILRRQDFRRKRRTLIGCENYSWERSGSRETSGDLPRAPGNWSAGFNFSSHNEIQPRKRDDFSAVWSLIPFHRVLVPPLGFDETRRNNGWNRNLGQLKFFFFSLFSIYPWENMVGFFVIFDR